MDYKEEQNGEIEALLSIYEGELEGKKQDGKYMHLGRVMGEYYLGPVFNIPPLGGVYEPGS